MVWHQQAFMRDGSFNCVLEPPVLAEIAFGYGSAAFAPSAAASGGDEPVFTYCMLYRHHHHDSEYGFIQISCCCWQAGGRW